MTDGSKQVLIKWKEFPECDNTWEDFTIVHNQFPDFQLEDKVSLLEGGNDGPTNAQTKEAQTYKRRKTPETGPSGSRVREGEGEAVI